MSLTRGQQKVERVTVTLVPTADEHSYENVPSTFSPLARSYEWRRAANMRYMIIPRKISSREVLIDVFIEPTGKTLMRNVSKAVESFVQHRVGSEWKGLKLGGISRPIVAAPPQRTFVRGTIEEMLGTKLIR